MFHRNFTHRSVILHLRATRSMHHFSIMSAWHAHARCKKGAMAIFSIDFPADADDEASRALRLIYWWYFAPHGVLNMQQKVIKEEISWRQALTLLSAFTTAHRGWRKSASIFVTKDWLAFEFHMMTETFWFAIFSQHIFDIWCYRHSPILGTDLRRLPQPGNDFLNSDISILGRW